MILRLAPLAAVGIAAALLFPVRHEAPRAVPPQTLQCPKGYSPMEFHAIGQRIEAGFPSGQVVAQHDLTVSGTSATGVGNYVVVLGCGREWSASERAAANAGLGTAPVVFPFLLPKGY